MIGDCLPQPLPTGPGTVFPSTQESFGRVTAKGGEGEGQLVLKRGGKEVCMF